MSVFEYEKRGVEQPTLLSIDVDDLPESCPSADELAEIVDNEIITQLAGFIHENN